MAPSLWNAFDDFNICFKIDKPWYEKNIISSWEDPWTNNNHITTHKVLRCHRMSINHAHMLVRLYIICENASLYIYLWMVMCGFKKCIFSDLYIYIHFWSDSVGFSFGFIYHNFHRARKSRLCEKITTRLLAIYTLSLPFVFFMLPFAIHIS